MKKLSIRQLHRFMRGPFAESIEETYTSHQIFCEADLQSFAWHEIRRFLKESEEKRGLFRVLNKPYLRNCEKFPDLVIFKNRKPWAIVELKESKRLMVATAKAERKKLKDARLKLRCKRGYLVYVARYGDKRVLSGPKGKGNAYHFFEVPIVLELKMSRPEIREWSNDFRMWSKYVVT